MIERFVIAALMAFNQRCMQILRCGIDTLMPSVGLHMGQRPTIDIDIMSYPRMPDVMCSQFTHLLGIRDKTIIVCVIRREINELLDFVTDLPNTQISIE